MAIDFTVDDGVALVTINRPEVHNAMDHEHYRLLSEAWIQVRDDSNVKVAIVTGAGEKSFCAGADLRSHLTQPWPLGQMWLTQRELLLNRGLEVWKPIIAAVNGYCLGGGSTLLFATDIRIACEDATFALTEVKRGLVPGNGGTQRILGQLPYPIAMEMLLTGDTIDAQTAARWGLINRVVPKAEVLPTAFSIARRIAANAPLAVQAAKELAIRAGDMDLATGLRWEQMTNRLLQTSQDVREGVSAFTEKRAPSFKGE
jgi:enoyl-CoA hydratase/carnithine racemase